MKEEGSSLTDRNVTFKLKGDASFSFLRAFVHHSS